MTILTTARKISLGIFTNLAIQMKMIARFSIPSLQFNVISQQKIQNGKPVNQLITRLFVDTYPEHVVITC